MMVSSMKCYRLFLIFLLMNSLTIASLYAQNSVAVVKSQYDKVEKVLKANSIPFDIIKLRDLENSELLRKYSALFLPCGIDKSEASNINVLAHGTTIKSVALNSDYYEINKEKIAENLFEFIKEENSLYVSGYSYKYLQAAFDVFTYYDDFPYMGLPGRIESEVKGDLANFSMKTFMALYMTHSGWISIKSAEGADILASATYKTPRGERSGPLNLLFKQFNGEIIYTSYHSTVHSDFRRFNVYRIASASLYKEINALVKSWEQKTATKIADAILSPRFVKDCKL